MYIKKSIITLLICVPLFCFSQTKEETLSYLNSKLTAHNNGSMYHSFQSLFGTFLSADLKIYLDGTNSSTLNFTFDARDALYITSSTSNNNVTNFVMSFKPNSVKLLGANGKVIEASGEITMASIIGMTKTDVDKFIKAYKHLISLYGGKVKDDPF